MSDRPVLPPAEYLVSYYCVHQNKHVVMSLEKSVRDVVKNHDGTDYGVNSSKYDEDKRVKKLVDDVMKRCGYKPKLNKDGKFKASSGAYWFKFVPAVN